MTEQEFIEQIVKLEEDNSKLKREIKILDEAFYNSLILNVVFYKESKKNKNYDVSDFIRNHLKKVNLNIDLVIKQLNASNTVINV